MLKYKNICKNYFFLSKFSYLTGSSGRALLKPGLGCLGCHLRFFYLGVIIWIVFRGCHLGGCYPRLSSRVVIKRLSSELYLGVVIYVVIWGCYLGLSFFLSKFSYLTGSLGRALLKPGPSQKGSLFHLSHGHFFPY